MNIISAKNGNKVILKRYKKRFTLLVISTIIGV